MSYEMYQYIFYGSVILCGIMFVVSVVLFFVWKIPKTIGMVTGIAEKRYIMSTKSNKKMVSKNKSVSKSSKSLERKSSDEYIRPKNFDYTADEITGEISESSDGDSTITFTDISEDDNPLQNHNAFKVLYEITYIHTNERI